jgi:hypothetical protein
VAKKLVLTSASSDVIRFLIATNGYVTVDPDQPFASVVPCRDPALGVQRVCLQPTIQLMIDRFWLVAVARCRRELVYELTDAGRARVKRSRPEDKRARRAHHRPP